MSSQGFILSLTMKTLIKYNLPFLNLQDSKEIILGRFKQAQCDWLAVVDQERFLGMVSFEVLSAALKSFSKIYPINAPSFVTTAAIVICSFLKFNP